MPKEIQPNRTEWIAPFLLALVAVAVASVAVWTIGRLHVRNEAVVTTGPNLAQAHRLQTLIEMKLGATRAYLLTRDTNFLASRARFGIRIASGFDSLASMHLTPEGRRLAQRLESQYAAYDAEVRKALEAGIGGAGERKRADFLLRRMGPHLVRLDAYTSALTANLEASHHQAVAESRAFTERGIGWVTLTCVLGLFLGSALAAGLNRRLNRARRQRDQYQSRLRAQESLLAAITDNTSLALSFQDARGLCTFMNPAAAQLTGFSPEEALGKNLHDLLHLTRPDGTPYPLSECAIFKAVTTGRRQRGEESIQRKDGAFIPIAFTSSPVLEAGDVAGMVVEAEDITDRKLSEQAMRASDERFQTLAKATNDAVYDWTVATGAIWWNEGVGTLFGFDPRNDNLDFAWWSSHIHPEDREELIRSLRLGLAGEGGVWHAEYRFQCADGTYKVAFDRGFMIRDGNGRTVRMIGAMMDVTDMRRVEEELRRFRLLVDESNDLICMSDFQGRCEYLNAAGLGMAGLAVDRKDIGNIFDCVFEQDREAASRIWTEAMREGQGQGEFRLRHRGTGKTIPVLWNVFVIRRPGGSGPFGVAIVGRDLTLLHEKEEQIRQGQKLEAIGHLAGGIAHDFNNILTVINGYGELLLERLPSGDPNRSLLGAMLDSGHRAAKLTAQLLAYGRKQVLQSRMLDLNEVVEETTGMLRRLLSEDIELKLQLTRPLEKVKADPTQINQILLNLCLNSRDAMAKGGVLLLETGLVELEAGMHGRFSELPPGRYVTISITDTGSGIPPEVQDHLFEPFFTTKPVGMGTGLGLSSVYGIVRQSGGGIEVHSQPGKGTIFRVYLPGIHETAHETRIPEHGGEARMRAKGRILLVEDEEPVRRITRKLLENAGYAVLEARDGVEALSLLEKSVPSPDLILTDAIMPRMGGPRLAEEAGRNRPSLKILFMSGYSEEAFPKKEGPGRDFHFLQKPFTFQTLLNAVQEAMEPQRIGG